MALDPKFTAALALHRFGFGPVPGAIAGIADDPRGALLAELERPGAGQVAAANLPNSAQAARAFAEYRAERLAQQKLLQRAKEQAPAGSGNAGASMSAEADAQPGAQTTNNGQNRPPELPALLVQNEAQVRVEAALSAPIGFVERLVWFWSNHFCVSTAESLSMAGAYEREAIRPHVLGHFVDMLTAVESHPAMLIYLSNAQSMGPNSVAGINNNRGLNENLARETLELHTLGVRGGYSQADVTSFAKVITGWTLINTLAPAHGGEFVCFKRRHEPGEQVGLGRHYLDTGFEQGRAVPDESWTPQRTKLKRPYDWHVGALRLAGARGVIARFMNGQSLLGEPMWRPPAPNGFPEHEAAWIDGLAQRVDVARTFAGRAADRPRPVAPIV